MHVLREAQHHAIHQVAVLLVGRPDLPGEADREPDLEWQHCEAGERQAPVGAQHVDRAGDQGDGDDGELEDHAFDEEPDGVRIRGDTVDD